MKRIGEYQHQLSLVKKELFKNFFRPDESWVDRFWTLRGETSVKAMHFTCLKADCDCDGGWTEDWSFREDLENLVCHEVPIYKNKEGKR